jgi:hypothetical protein
VPEIGVSARVRQAVRGQGHRLGNDMGGRGHKLQNSRDLRALKDRGRTLATQSAAR